MARTGPRYEGDTWDLASSVGATATMVAAARAIASTGDGALISDPYAEPLVRAVGVDFFTRLAGGELTLEELDGDTSDGATVGMARMTDNMAVRTKFFDEFFEAAGAAGVRQAVILASGLDARAYRLAWPAGTTVFEIDQPDVIAFKSQAMADLGAEPTAQRRAVAIDLRFDWPAALRAAGFDPALPTAWSAEGLLGYLPPEAQDKLLDTITELSAPGSWVAVESGPASSDPDDREKVLARMQESAQRWREHGFELDFSELVYIGDRNEAGAYLENRGWRLTRRTVGDLLAENGLPPLPEDDEAGRFGEMQYIIGILEK
ncbi:SAM-dependent methyltransferase [Mycolicibacterium novocastrense]|uniref:class I SAM-dependent methyltransferase n=1 Tax=Mycolicibacterium novocastrense TaxID=59813 RepID=UPI000748512A|nr:class I SAM-dependent methyltransferase [Mycolicibacterium novocastrense]KUH68001.1 SAM-dependent methyltransferase [Mycolicibacterium novocastrense]KUH68473.1 SAM-dependent methyltransferase [Mycolicibacterium novocastrense]KUH73554.1 SAM-dependent methyltransferase [Mycolicibacterium novocastrense]